MKNPQRGKVLVDYQIKELINKGNLIGSGLERQVQPVSFDPTIGDELFIKNTIVRPDRADKQVYRTILETEYRRNKIKDSFELQVGKTYYFRLEERLNLTDSGVNFIKATPKSSTGRIFLYTRLISDFSSSFDEVTYTNKIKDKNVDLWLVVQPLAFNVLVYPGLSLNQLKFFRGRDYMLSDSEIMNLHKKYEIVKGRRKIEVNKGLKLHLNLYGKDTEGIVGLKARESLEPLDMKEQANKIETFFEPIISKSRKIIFKPGDKAIFYTTENLYIPKETNGQLSDFNLVALRAELHLAGFFDAYFQGTPVLEVLSNENRDIEFWHKMHMGILEFHRNDIPEKVYGDKELGSHYQHQRGPKVAKYCIPADYPDLKKKHKKLKRKIITVPRLYVNDLLKEIGKKEFIFLDDSERAKLEEVVLEKPLITRRYDCEHNSDLLQPIPYVLIFNEKGQVMVYKRAESKQDYGDERLFGKISIGAGGHFVEKDKTLGRCIEREVMQEELDIQGMRKLKFVGSLYTERKEVDTVHLGMIYAMLVKDAHKKERALKNTEFVSLEELACYPGDKESWTQILEPYLSKIYKRLGQT